MELTTSQAAELSIRLGAFMANHLSQMDSLERLDLATAMAVIDGTVEVASDELERSQIEADEARGYEEDISDIGRSLGGRYMDAEDIIVAIHGMQAELARYKEIENTPVVYTITKVGGECDWLVYINTAEDVALADYYGHYGDQVIRAPNIKTFQTAGRLWAYDLADCDVIK